MLGVEDEVDRGQTDVLVAAAVAGDEVRVEQLVVVGRRAEVVAEQAFRVSVGSATWGIGAAAARTVWIEHSRSRVMGDVIEEGVAGAERVGRHQGAQSALPPGIRLDEPASWSRTGRSRSGRG